jgi:hypothetical protein
MEFSIRTVKLIQLNRIAVGCRQITNACGLPECGHTNGEPYDIDKTEDSVFKKVPVGDLEIIPEHVNRITN